MATEPAPSVRPIYETRTTCRACEENLLIEVLNLGNQYLPNFVGEEDPTLPRAPLRLVRCEHCGLLQLGESVDPMLLWEGDYWYRSGVNATMRAALDDVVHTGLKYHQGGCWIDIGANDGTLLSRVPSEFTKIGVDPAGTFRSELEEHADQVVGTYFRADALEGVRANVITSCAMFYDLDDPNAFVADIAATLTRDGVWINQLNDTPSMLSNNAWDGICHEHRCYYDVPTLKKLYERHGLHICGVSHNGINGGSVRIEAQKLKSGADSVTMGTRQPTLEQVQQFAWRVERWKQIGQELLNLPGFRDVPLWGYGASTKGCVILQHLNLTDRFVGLADRNPIKHGKVMAGTWIPVTDESAMRRSGAKLVMPLIWAFRKEILDRESQLRANGATFLFPLPSWEVLL